MSSWNMGLLGAASVVPNDFELISTTTLSSQSASVTLSSIPQTYRHLQIRAALWITGGFDEYFLTFNGDTNTSSYRRHFLRGNGSGVSSGQGLGIPFTQIGNGQISPQIIDILDYASNAKNTTIRSLHGQNQTSANFILLTSGAWFNTAAVTSINFATGNGFIGATSRISLYGIKG